MQETSSTKVRKSTLGWTFVITRRLARIGGGFWAVYGPIFAPVELGMSHAQWPALAGGRAKQQAPTLIFGGVLFYGGAEATP